MSKSITPAALHAALTAPSSDAPPPERAILDVREEVPFADGHLLTSVNLPLSQLELRLAHLVPRNTVPIIVCDGGESRGLDDVGRDETSLTDRAASRLEALGYENVSVLAGGAAAWRDAGFELFSGINVYSKAFGEFVEARDRTPSLSAAALNARIAAGDRLVVLDSRTFEEYRRMNIPGAMSCPGGELAYRVRDIAPDPDMLVVVNCAGRTRSIIGAQSLIHGGIANPVMALENGTMGWHLAGYPLETGQDRRPPAVSAAGLDGARAAANRMAVKSGVVAVDGAMLAAWRADPARTLYLLDVRMPEEYAAGHLPGALSAPGGQLVQAIDRTVAVQGARLVLIDDDGVRAKMTGSWLAQMGLWEVATLEMGAAGVALETGPPAPHVLGLDGIAPDGITTDGIAPGDLAPLLSAGAAVLVDLASSADYKAGHAAGAWFAIRARLGSALPRLPTAPLLALTSPDGVLARLAAPEAAAIWARLGAGRRVAVLAGGTHAWRRAGFPLTAGAHQMASAPDDIWLRPYDRDGDQEAASQAYLDWETALPDQVARDRTARFRAFSS